MGSSQLSFTVRREAIVSDCRNYRYLLTRDSGTSEEPLTFIMLNPSTADALEDDPTIRRCMGFGRALGCSSILARGCSGIRVVNLFAWRATDKTRLAKLAFDVAVGPENDRYVRDALRGEGTVVAAWGEHTGELGRMVRQRVWQVTAMCSQERKILWCLGRTQGGQPRHPLYLPKTAMLDVWRGL